MGCGQANSGNVAATNPFSPVQPKPKLRKRDIRLLFQAGLTVIRRSLGLDI
jgi:hypothetical protein